MKKPFSFGTEVRVIRDGEHEGYRGLIDGRWKLSSGVFKYSITGLMLSFYETELVMIP